MKNEICLNDAWEAAFISHEDFTGKKLEITSRGDLERAGAVLYKTKLPTNNELVLMDNGVIPDLNYGMNPIKERACEYLHAFYTRELTYEGAGQPYLRFEGVDTAAEYYCNGELVSTSENMFIEHKISALPLRRGKNEILVHIIPAVIAARKYEHTIINSSQLPCADGLYLRKGAYMFGWDIFPRMVSGGIWRDVYLGEEMSISVSQAYCYTCSADKNGALLNFFFELEFGDCEYTDCTVELSGVCGDSSFSVVREVFSKSGNQRIHLPEPKLWYPRGRGSRNLYDGAVTVRHRGEIAAKKTFRFGIRTVRLDKSSNTTPSGDGRFCFVINGEPVFVLGTNFVPLDSFPSRAREKIPRFVQMCDELNINMIRIWGGGYYEDELLFDLCDERGIMIWQDFMMGCGTYPQDDDFQARMQTEITAVVKKYRQHPSLVLWSGDNECDWAWDWAYGRGIDPNRNRITRQTIPDCLFRHDYIREYLPSSPYIDEKCFADGGANLAEDHLWGPRDYYKGDYYRTTICHFASETGYHGCPSPESVKKFISPDALYPFDNDEWLLHGSSYTTQRNSPFSYRIDLMARQVKTMFGEIPATLEKFSAMSQASQGEAMKYFIERFRMGKWRRTGIIWWNLLDGCPQFSDAVVDYYFEKKAAYYYIMRSQTPVCMMFSEPEDGRITLYAVNDTRRDESISYTVTRDGETVCSGEYFSRADTSAPVCAVEVSGGFEFFIIRYKTSSAQGVNHYIPTTVPFDAETYFNSIKLL